MKQTKFDLLRQCYKELHTQLEMIDHELIRGLMNSWDLSFKQIDEHLASKAVTKSKITSGLEQGLKELPELLSDLPDTERNLALQKYKVIMAKHV